MEPRFLAGKLNPSDGLSRNPADRDQVLARRLVLLANPKLLEREFDSGEYEDLEIINAARRVWFAGLWEDYEYPVSHAIAMTDSGLPVPVMPLLFVPSWENPSPEDLHGRFVTEDPLQELAFQVSIAEYPFSDDTGLGLWIPMLKE